MKRKVHVVAHTHWDREWYFTIYDSKTLLSKNLTYLIDILEKDKNFKSFHYDGQVSLIEDYLDYNSQNLNKIKKLVKSKRLFVGPWYTQPDLNLSSTESIIRNLQYGISKAKDLGHSMNVGYLPDTFGFNNQMPQILKQFGIDNIIFWRGLDLKDTNNNMYFNWTSPNGDSILAILLRYGYGAGKYFSDDEKLFSKTSPMIKEMSNLTNLNLFLLPSGGDQVGVDKELPKKILSASKKDKENDYFLSSYEDFVKDLKQNIKNKKLFNYNQILKAPFLTRIHKTIGSVRMDVKQKIFKLEDIIVNQLEPLLVFASKYSIEYNEKILEDIWKKLLSAQAHDSYGMCNSDETNRSIDQRVSEALEVATGLITLTCKQLLNNLNNLPSNILFVYNQKLSQTKHFVKAFVSSEFNNIFLVSKNKKIKPNILSLEKIEGAKEIVVTPEGEKEVKQPSYYVYKIYFEIELKPNTFEIFEIVENKENLIEENHASIKNEFFEIYIKENSLNLNLIKDKKEIKNFLTPQIEIDAGDQYDFSPIEKIKKIEEFSKIESISIIKGSFPRMKIKATVLMPKDEQDWFKNIKNLNQEIFLDIGLFGNKIEIKTNLNNLTNDSRYRLLLKGFDSKDGSYEYDNTSSLVKENGNYLNNWKEKKYKENPILVNNHHHFIKFNDSKLNLVLTKGTKEHEFIKNKGLYLTLFKTVGFLGRDDLENRPGRASGINNIVVKTPDGQMLNKKLSFLFSISYEEKTNPFIKSNEINNLIVYNKQKWNKFSYRLDRFDFNLGSKFNISNNKNELIIENKNFIVLSNYIWNKKKYLRLINISNSNQDLKINKNLIRRDFIGNATKLSLKNIRPFEIVNLEYK